MSIWELPASTKVNKSIPKNAFDINASSRNKKQFIEYVDKILWRNKIADFTVNLPYSEYQEFQIFEITLRKKAEITELLNLMDKTILYPVVFLLIYGEEMQISVAIKHLHPAKPNTTVIDWRFSSEWFTTEQNPYILQLTKSIDHTLTNLCTQLSSTKNEEKNLKTLIEREQTISKLQNEIAALTAEIKRTKQFKKKVELNLKLQKLSTEYQIISG